MVGPVGADAYGAAAAVLARLAGRFLSFACRPRISAGTRLLGSWGRCCCRGSHCDAIAGTRVGLSALRGCCCRRCRCCAGRCGAAAGGRERRDRESQGRSPQALGQVHCGAEGQGGEGGGDRREGRGALKLCSTGAAPRPSVQRLPPWRGVGRCSSLPLISLRIHFGLPGIVSAGFRAAPSSCNVVVLLALAGGGEAAGGALHCQWGYF